MYEKYYVKSNEQLNDISYKYGISETEIIELNDLINSKLFEGQMLRLPKSKELGFNTYIVQNGDTLYDLSEKYDIDVNTLTKINGLDNNEYLYVDQQLIIPNNNTGVYITNKDDTLDIVSKRTNEDKFDLIKNNNIYLLDNQTILYKK